jgi:hypothetical protein
MPYERFAALDEGSKGSSFLSSGTGYVLPTGGIWLSSRDDQALSAGVGVLGYKFLNR